MDTIVVAFQFDILAFNSINLLLSLSCYDFSTSTVQRVKSGILKNREISSLVDM